MDRGILIEAETLSARRRRALEALLTEPTTRAAAAAARVSEATIWRWLSEPVFSEAYRRARSVLFESTMAGLQAIVSDAVRTLHAIMNDETNAASVRVNAAGKLMEAGFKSRDVMDTETRLAELEARFAAMSKGAN